ncbi:MAG: HD domain-containing protein [Armatimonadota bacterium]
MNALERIAEATRGTKWEGRLFAVGGCVRDSLMGLPEGTEFDIVSEESSQELARFLYTSGVSSINPVTYPRFGTALVHIGDANVEIVTARRESYDPESRKPEVAPATLLDDARRRDFTINTLLRNLHTGEMLDPLGTGLQDLRERVLRTPLDPQATFSDDPLRMLRAVRFRRRLDLTPAEGLYDAIRRTRERLRIVSAERIRNELVLMLEHTTAADALDDLMDLGLLELFLPELKEGVDVDQGDYHSKPVWEHTLDVVRNAAVHGDLRITLAALFHDVAKPRTKGVDDEGRIRFFGHERVGAEMTREAMRRLRFSRDLTEQVAALVRNHMRLGSMPVFTPTAARRLLRDLGELVDPLIKLCRADAEAIRAGPPRADFDAIERRLAEVRATATPKQLSSPLTGSEVMAILHLPEGPEVGKWLRRLDDAVLEGEVPPNDKRAAHEWLLRQTRGE